MSGAGQAIASFYGAMGNGLVQLGQQVGQRRMMANLKPLQPDGEHGSREWLTHQEMVAAGLRWERPAGDPKPCMPVLGIYNGETWTQGTTFSGKPKIVSQISGHFYDVYPGDRHGLSVGPNGSGKSQKLIANLVLNPCPAIVNDPKGELVKATGSYREQEMGSAIYPIDPLGISNVAPNRRARFNPLDVIRLSRNPTEYALLMSYAIVPQQASESNPFFTLSARKVFQATTLFVALDGRFAADQRHFGTVRTILSESARMRHRYFSDMAESDNLVVRAEGKQAVDRMEADKGGRDDVLATVLANIAFLGSDEMIDCMCRSDLDFRDFRKRNSTVYLCLPAGLTEAYGGWQRLIYLSAMAAIESCGPIPDHEMPVRFYMDETPALGRFKELLTYFPIGRGYGMRFNLYVQSLSQLKEIYGEAWEVLFENCGYVELFGGNSGFTAEFMSKQLGKRTINVGSQNRSTVWGQGGPSAGYTENLIGQDLMAPADFSVMRPGEQVTFYPGVGASRGRFFFINQHIPWLKQWESIPLRDREPVRPALPSPAPSFTPAVVPARAKEAVRVGLPPRMVKCPRDGQKLSVPADRGKIRVKCPCGHAFLWSPA